jgi:hypothetical protein
MFMIPVREGKDDFFVVEVLVRIFWIIDYESSAEAVWVLPTNMGMIPVRPRLVDLKVQRMLGVGVGISLTVKLYVKVLPGITAH